VSIFLDCKENADEVGVSTCVFVERKETNSEGERRSSREGSTLFIGGRVAAISGAGESPRERLSVGTDHPDSDEHNTIGVG